MKKVFLLLAIMVIANGCSGKVAATKISGPTGGVAYIVKCKKSVAYCMQKLGTLCKGSAYDIISDDTHAGGVFADILPGPTVWHTVVATCKQP